MRHRPRRRFAGILNPMGQSGLITPLRQPRHNAAVHARLHEGAHRPLVPPHRPGPEGAIGVANDRDRQAPSRPLGLACRTNGLIALTMLKAAKKGMPALGSKVRATFIEIGELPGTATH